MKRLLIIVAVIANTAGNAKKAKKKQSLLCNKGLIDMENMRKAIVLFFLLVFSSAAFCDSISNYIVSNPVALGKNFTIYGVYSGTPSADVLCAFYIFDVENLDTNAAVLRLKDNYSFSDGSFYAEYKITEPLFQRGIDYNAVTKCGTTETGQVFNVGQKEDIVAGITSNAVISDVRFFVSPENSLITLFALVLIVAGIFFAAWVYSLKPR